MWVGLFKFMGENIPGGNFLGENSWYQSKNPTWKIATRKIPTHQTTPLENPPPPEKFPPRKQNRIINQSFK